MAVAFVAAETGTKVGAGGTSLVINVPTGTVDGDCMIAVVLTGTATTAATQASWTTLDTQASGPTVRSFSRIAASEPASYTFTVVDPQTSTGFILTYTGTHATTPVDQHAAWNRLTSTANISGTTITPSVNDCMIVWIGGGGAAVSSTPPGGGYTERADISLGGILSTGAELLQTTATATGTITGTASASTNTQGSLLAIRPPDAGVTEAPYPYVGGGYYPTQG